eukprot:359443-Pleurochrysis_carterae.AAC.1
MVASNNGALNVIPPTATAWDPHRDQFITSIIIWPRSQMTDPPSPDAVEHALVPPRPRSTPRIKVRQNMWPGGKVQMWTFIIIANTPVLLEMPGSYHHRPRVVTTMTIRMAVLRPEFSILTETMVSSGCEGAFLKGREVMMRYAT